jgi:hypothetical protein
MFGAEEAIPMGARQKLNRAYFFGSLLVASMIGGLAQSWLAFLLALLVLLATNLLMGEIRPTHRGR